jgi:sterol desaturase/sphingolipid hydroxylase (fatty acid hydroxylase superfamily)
MTDLPGRLLERIDLLAIGLVLLTWANMLLGTYIAYRGETHTGGTRSLRGFFRYAFPRELLLHRSSLVDYGFIIVQKLSFPILIAPAFAVLYGLGHLSSSALENWFGLAHPPEGASWWASLAFSVLGLTLAADFADFWTHRLMHRVWWLWEIHKVHHSAEVMVLGATARRNHPIEDIIRLGSGIVLSGLVFGVFAYGFGLAVEEVTFAGIDVFLLIKLLSFYHLKHGHAPLRFGPVLERILVSPAQHQLHHSCDPRHYDSNFGTLVAWWDILYGSWRRSEPERHKLGLQDGEHLEYSSVWKLYYVPLKKIWLGLRAPRVRGGAAPQTV